MLAEDKFVTLSVLICEPTRAKMLWTLLDGRAYTASELSIAADVSATSAMEGASATADTERPHVSVRETEGVPMSMSRRSMLKGRRCPPRPDARGQSLLA